MNYFQKHIGDWRVATGKLTRIQRDIYSELIETYYDQEGPLVGGVSRIAEDQGCRTDEERQALSYILDRFFQLDGDVYRHERCDTVIAEYHEYQAKQVAAGKASASSRALKKIAAAGGSPTPPNGGSTTVQPPTTHYPLTNLASPSGEAGGVSANAPTPTKRASKRAPAEFLVDKEMAAWAMGHKNGLDWEPVLDAHGNPANLLLHEVKSQTALFRDHQFPQGITDWVAAWRKWIRKFASGWERERSQRVKQAGPTGVALSRKEAKQARDADIIERATGRKPNHADTTPRFDLDVESRVIEGDEGKPVEPDAG